jgi:hypothetical protein
MLKLLIPFREKIVFNLDNQTRYANKLCGHNCALFTLKADGACSYSWVVTVGNTAWAAL